VKSTHCGGFTAKSTHCGGFTAKSTHCEGFTAKSTHCGGFSAKSTQFGGFVLRCYVRAIVAHTASDACRIFPLFLSGLHSVLLNLL
jgi:hypothetical protein